MKIIGITGGVGSGKTELLRYIKERYSCRMILADQAAHQVEQKGGLCYEKLLLLLGDDICGSDGQILKAKMAERIFADQELLTRVNEIVHPAVKQYILEEIRKEKEKGDISFFFIEAALLIEDRYDLICDELWYIYADQEVRRRRLKASRGYEDKKIDAIMATQLPEDEFRKHCSVVIDNSKTLAHAYGQIDAALGGIRDGNR